ncbi:uncharacterized protein LOC121871272 [Homarus americanus]|uniref:uncharacterized protein LOC121871272 n=1 Tax=Homarus americanus TaxID=6706 RepID=UPI001C44256A|nr:uncharacterized protein LOC121871272 [Homarus americanus]
MTQGCHCVMVLQLLVVMLAVRTTPVSCHVMWTSILPASQDQVDLWTVSGTGCTCPHLAPGHTPDCACCVSRVACPCGEANPHRCAQCGLHQHCNNIPQLRLSLDVLN